MKSNLIKALKMKYESDKQDALARLEVYLSNSVGIGEHPQITEEMDNLVDQYASAEDKLGALKSMMKDLES